MDINELIQAGLVHEIHTSERKSFKACRRRWSWLFQGHYYPRVTAKPLEFGVCYHKAMEFYYNPETWHMDAQVRAAATLTVFKEECEKQRQEALDNQSRVALNDDVEEDYDERVELGVGMLKYYFEKHAPELDQNWEPIAVEQGFKVAIPHPHKKGEYIWCKCIECWDKWMAQPVRTKTVGDTVVLLEEPEWLDRSRWKGLPVVYAGRLDVLGKNTVNGNLWIIDWKTAATIRDNDEVFMLLDDQIGSYVWALRALGVPVRGFVYHEQKKAFPQEPKMLKRPYKGCMFSTNKQNPMELEVFKACIMEHDNEAYEKGLYDEYLTYLENDAGMFYRRTVIHKTDYETEQIAYNIGLEALDMINPELAIYPNAGRFGCNFCAFREPCLEKNAGGDFEYMLNTLYDVREHYYVRQESSTESKGGK